MSKIKIGGLLAAATAALTWILLYPARKAQNKAADEVGDALGDSLDSLYEEGAPQGTEFSLSVSSWFLHNIEVIIFLAAVFSLIGFVMSKMR